MSEERKEYKKPRIISGKLFDTSFACQATAPGVGCIIIPKTGCNPGTSAPSVCWKT